MGWLKTSVCVSVLGVCAMYLPSLFQVSLPRKGEGFAGPGWRKVADVFKRHLETGAQRGGVFSLYHKGEPVVEFWGGYADAEARMPWVKDTLAQYCSTTKVIAAIIIAQLVDKGLMSYSEPVAKYWPEFAQNGKADITVDMLLSHQAGVPATDTEYTAFDTLNDPANIGRVLAEQTPLWTPGEGHGYHGLTLGLYADQLVRRVDPHHRSISQYFDEEIARPLGLDFFVGLPKEENYRCARCQSLSMTTLPLQILQAPRYAAVIWAFLSDGNSMINRQLANPKEYNGNEPLWNNPYFRELPIVSSHGYGTGASMAKLLSLVASGEEEKPILTAGAVQRLTEPLTSGHDLTLLMNTTFGRATVIRDAPHGGRLFGHPGAGGQMGYGDPKTGLGWSFLTSYHTVHAFGDSPLYLELEAAMFESWAEIQSGQG